MANFNETFDSVKEKVTQGAQAAMQKTRDLTAIAKANVAIKTEEGKIRKAEIELGKLFYADYTAGTTPGGEAYIPWCDKITECKRAIDEQKAVIDLLRSKKEDAAACAEDADDVVVDITEDDLVAEDSGSEDSAEADAEEE